MIAATLHACTGLTAICLELRRDLHRTASIEFLVGRLRVPLEQSHSHTSDATLQPVICCASGSVVTWHPR